MFSEYFQQKVNNVIETAREGLEQQIEDKLEEICIKALGSLFSRVVEDIQKDRRSYDNRWVGSYNHQALEPDYQVKKFGWGADSEDYFKARHYFSKQNPRLKKYPYSQSLFAIFQRASQDKSLGKQLYRMSGGAGLSPSGSGVDYSKGRLVDGKPKKFGKNKLLVNARWQDIVSKEWLKRTRFNLPKGYFRSDNPNRIVTPQGRSISKARAIAEGIITFNLKGSFFDKISKDDQGFLNFILKTNELKRYSKGRNVNSVLGGLAVQGRHILDPVFGEVLEEINLEFDRYVRTL